MDEPGYRSPVGAGTHAGCIAAFAFAAVMLVPALLLAAVGDCWFGPCRKDGPGSLAAFLLLLLVPAGLFGLSVRAVVRWRSEADVPAPLWAFTILALLGAVAAWIVLVEFGPFPLLGW